MGTITKGILGGFSGTVGTVIGGSWKGISYMRSTPSRKTSASSVSQIEQQLKFALMIRFLQTMTGLLEVTFKNYANKMTAFNSAFSYNIKNAVTGTSPDFAVDYSKVLISRGKLPNGGSPSAAAGAGGNTVFSWTDNSGAGEASATDLAVLAVYCEEMNLCIYTTAGTARSTGTDTLNTDLFSGKQVQTYIGFINADGTNIASGLFTGQLTLS